MQTFHGFCVSAPRSGEGKTTVSMGLMRAFVRRGLTVQAFKCGPDYIDPTFHAEATGRIAYNIDTWMMGEKGVKNLWLHGIGENPTVGICEGVMGLFDGRKVGSLEGSTLHCAQALNIAVVLVFNARGMAASVAALARGFCEQAKEYGVHIMGFIANNVGSKRHEDILRKALEWHKLPPLLGAIPRKSEWTLPERQLGLVPQAELKKRNAWYDALADEVENHCNLDLILELSELDVVSIVNTKDAQQKIRFQKKKTLAIAKDKAFCFYYVENEMYLEKLGYELLPFSPIQDAHLPENIDAVYLGGGYPEVFAKELFENESMRTSIHNFAENGGEIYAECGGYMYLCKNLQAANSNEEKVWEMCGVINATATMGKGIRSLGYRQAKLLCAAPFGLEKKIYRGHEFHWSAIEHHEEYAPLYSVEVGDKIKSLGVHHKNIKAGYLHLYWGVGCYEG